MSRTYLSIGPGGPRVGVIVSGRGFVRALAIIGIPFGLLAFAGNIMDKTDGSGLAGFGAAAALAALLWFAWTRPAKERGKPAPFFNPKT
jgi:hypothetical protein